MSNQEKEHVKCLIIGSGPAGYTAAIYASRADLKPVVYQGLQPGGQLTITTEVENYPGYPKGTMGPAMMDDFKAQAERFGADIRWGLATSVDFSKRPFKVTIDEDKEVLAESVIIATGASAKWLGIESEQRLNGFGVSACAVCDGFFFKKQDVVVVGGGDTAAEEASYLAKLCNKVYLVVRKNQMRASKSMIHRVEKTSNIEVIYNHQVKEIIGEKTVQSAVIYHSETKEERILNVTGVFVAIGHQPNTDVFKNYLELDKSGYIVTQAGSTKTNVEGIFAAGDVQDSIYRQAVTAAGSGCMAALDAERFLAEKGVH